MLPRYRSLLLGAVSLLVLSACGSSSSSSTAGTSAGMTGGSTTSTGPTPIDSFGSGTIQSTGTHDSVVATPTTADTVSALIGTTRTVSIAFTSSDGRAISGFGVLTNAGTLPDDWSGPATFSCSQVSTGSGCVLNLTYAPTAASTGALILNYVFVDNDSLPRTGGSLNIPYAATAYNNVTASVSPTGQSNAVIGGAGQSVGINFTTDDGNAATNLVLTGGLTALAPGWTSKAPSFSCAIVSTGSSCQLVLAYAPTSAASGTLTLNFTYTDDTGSARTGALNIPYSSIPSGGVVAAVAPSGQINAVQKTGGQSVPITFTTADGKPATDLFVTSNLASLPAGWSSASSNFSCISVSSGNGCELRLTYAPAALTSGTVTLNYAYKDESGALDTGSLNIPYAATTNNNAVVTPSPSGQIVAVAPTGVQAVAVTFTTDDGRPATALAISNDLTALPTGWTSAAPSFACSGINGGSACQLMLTYAPLVADSGTLTLNYAYLNNAGAAKSGMLNIDYRATTNNNIVATVPAPQNPLAVTVPSSTLVTVTFTTDDGNLASGFSVTSGLGASLPAGWSSSQTALSCGSVGAGQPPCQLLLTYAPIVPTAPPVTPVVLGYTYTSNSGVVGKTGTLTLSYSAL